MICPTEAKLALPPLYTGVNHYWSPTSKAVRSCSTVLPLAREQKALRIDLQREAYQPAHPVHAFERHTGIPSAGQVDRFERVVAAADGRTVRSVVGRAVEPARLLDCCTVAFAIVIGERIGGCAVGQHVGNSDHRDHGFLQLAGIDAGGVVLQAGV